MSRSKTARREATRRRRSSLVVTKFSEIGLSYLTHSVSEFERLFLPLIFGYLLPDCWTYSNKMFLAYLLSTYSLIALWQNIFQENQSRIRVMYFVQWIVLWSSTQSAPDYLSEISCIWASSYFILTPHDRYLIWASKTKYFRERPMFVIKFLNVILQNVDWILL